MEFVHEEDFTSAFYGAHRTILDGSQILVDFMRAQTVPGWVPRRLGGGVGGKKQSGQMRFGGRDCPFHAPYESNRFIAFHRTSLSFCEYMFYKIDFFTVFIIIVCKENCQY